MTTYNKIQILEFLAQLRQHCIQEGCDTAYLDVFDGFADDLLKLMNGQIKPMVAKDILLIPEFGFVPYVGTIGEGGKITYFKPDDLKNGGETC